MGTQPESRLSRAIKTMLRARGCYAIKIHGGPTMEAGTPDILVSVPVGFDDNHGSDERIVGIFVGFETKMPDGGNPTPIQELRHAQIRAAGGQVFVVRSVEDAVYALESIGWTAPPKRPARPSASI